jgi:D-alanyl-D-alanine carboxypeptidase (penicillin-binding protein 5/6)
MADKVELSITEDIFLTIPRGAQDSLEANLHIDDVIKAPIVAGVELGNLTVSLDGEELVNRPLLAQKNIAEAGFFSRLWDNLVLFFGGLF